MRDITNSGLLFGIFVSCNNWTHCREEQDILKVKHDVNQYQNYLDVIVVGQQHCETIDATSPACSWGQSIFQSIDKILINHLCLFISGVLVLKFDCLIKDSNKPWLVARNALSG